MYYEELQERYYVRKSFFLLFCQSRLFNQFKPSIIKRNPEAQELWSDKSVSKYGMEGWLNL